MLGPCQADSESSSGQWGLNPCRQKFHKEKLSVICPWLSSNGTQVPTVRTLFAPTQRTVHCSLQFDFTLPLKSSLSQKVWKSFNNVTEKILELTGGIKGLSCGRSRKSRFVGQGRTRQSRVQSTGTFSSAKDVSHHWAGVGVGADWASVNPFCKSAFKYQLALTELPFIGSRKSSERMKSWVTIYCWHKHGHVKDPVATGSERWQNLPRRGKYKCWQYVQENVYCTFVSLEIYSLNIVLL